MILIEYDIKCKKSKSHVGKFSSLNTCCKGTPSNVLCEVVKILENNGYKCTYDFKTLTLLIDTNTNVNETLNQKVIDNNNVSVPQYPPNNSIISRIKQLFKKTTNSNYTNIKID